MSRRPFHRRPPAIQVGQPRQTDLTFENTSLEPFLRQYTRMNSRESGGGDKQFADEINFSRRLVEEMGKWRDASPQVISDLVTNITDPKPPNGYIYPTSRSNGVSDDVARENRIIIAMILIHHARSDKGDGRDGGVSSGGLWLPPRAPALEEQNRAQAEGRPPIYPTWSREGAVALTPRIRDNWTSSGQPSPYNGRNRGLPGSPAGRVPPFVPAQDRSPLSAGFPSSPYTVPSGYGVPPSSPGWSSYDTFQPQRYSHNQLTVPNSQSGRIVPNSEIYLTPYGVSVSSSYQHSPSGYSLQPHESADLRLDDSMMDQVHAPPGLERQNLGAFGRDNSGSSGPLQAPIGSNRPHPGREGGTIRDNALNTPRCGRPSSPETVRRKTPGSRRSRRESSRSPNADDP